MHQIMPPNSPQSLNKSATSSSTRKKNSHLYQLSMDQEEHKRHVWCFNGLIRRNINVRIDRNLHAFQIASKFKDEVGLYRWSCSLQSHPVRNRKKPRNKSAMYLNQTINCPLPASTPRQRKWIWSQTNMQSRAHSERKKRDITWYNHPFNSNVKTNLGKSSSISSINASRKTVSIRFSTDTLSN